MFDTPLQRVLQVRWQSGNIDRMGSTSGSRRGKGASKSDSDDTFRQLEKDFDKLHNKAQKLITERVYLENEVASLKKKAGRLEEEIRQLKSPPLIIGFILC